MITCYPGLHAIYIHKLARWFWLILVLMVTLSATQDIVVDAYTIRLLDTREYGAANGMRVTAYRAAMLVAGGVVVFGGGRFSASAYATSESEPSSSRIRPVCMPSTSPSIATSSPISRPIWNDSDNGGFPKRNTGS